MSYTTITQCARDPKMQDRIIAAANKEAIGNAALGGTQFGKQVNQGTANIVGAFAYPVAVDNEAEYQYAVESNNPDPGGDPGVISDADIGSAIQAHWPYAEGETSA